MAWIGNKITVRDRLKKETRIESNRLKYFICLNIYGLKI